VAGRDNLHSRLVAWLKVILPLLALVILSTLFLISRAIDPSDAIPFAEVDVEDRIREPRMTAPTYAGVTTDGAALILTAKAALPDAGQGASATAVHAELATPDGATTTVEAATLALDTAAGVARMAGGVTVASSSGYRLTTDSLTAALDRTRLESGGAVQATGPMGDLAAGSLTLTEAPEQPGAYVLVFKDGVKLIYQPAK
jgi:lipopolysaccharide export system protein LptC